MSCDFHRVEWATEPTNHLLFFFGGGGGLVGAEFNNLGIELTLHLYSPIPEGVVAELIIGTGERKFITLVRESTRVHK